MLIKELKNKSTRLLWWNLFVCVEKKLIFLSMKALGSGVLHCSSDIKDQTILWNSSEVKGLRTVNKAQSKHWIKENLDTLTIRQHLLHSNRVTWNADPSPMGSLQGTKWVICLKSFRRNLNVSNWFAQTSARVQSKVRDFRMNSNSFLHVVAHSNFYLLFNKEII